MKKIFISVLSLAIFSGVTQNALAQEDKIKASKQEEIVIRKNGDKDAKVAFEVYSKIREIEKKMKNITFWEVILNAAIFMDSWRILMV